MAFTIERPEHRPGLPVFRSPLIGRERELATLGRLLTQSELSLITLTGPGGVGKTRLAIQAAAQVNDAFDDGVLFVALGTVRDPALVTQAIAQSSGIVMQSGNSAGDALRRHFRERSCLIVIDNFEQVIEAAADLGELIASCPRLTLLVTSRESLRIGQEQEVPVRPLSVNGGDDQLSTLQAGPPAVELFVQRARAVDPGLEFAGDDLVAISELCARLDGLPLAIELAAARIKLLSPNLMLDRLDDRFGLLSRDARGLPLRLRSMRDTLDWSYELLTEPEQRLFRWLSVFRGGFTIAAAEAVCGLGGEPAGDWLVLDGLSSLIDKSLVIPLERPVGQFRFGMLETVRAYASDQLNIHNESGVAHAAMTTWIRALIASAHTESFGPQQPAWTLLLEQEHANLCSALEWTVEQGNAEAASALIYSALGSWYTSGRFREGRAWAERALEISDASVPFATGALLLAAGWLSLYEGNLERSIDYLARARPVAVEAADPLLLAQIIHARAAALGAASQFEAARSAFEEALQLYRAHGLAIWSPQARNGLGHVVFESGAVEEAEEHFDAALAEFRALQNAYGEAAVLTNLAKVARARADYPRSIELFQQGLALRWTHGDRPGIVGCLRGLATTLSLIGKAALAMRLYGACEKLRLSTGLPPAGSHSSYWEALERARDRLGPVKSEQYWIGGQLAALDQIVSEATEPLTQAPVRIGPRADQLTPRELEVLKLLREGCSNRVIAERLFISDRTAQTHVQHILDKLGVPTRGAAAVAAVEMQIA